MKRCSKCEAIKPLKDFSKQSSANDGLHPHCKSCCSEYHKLYRKINKDRLNRRSKKWAMENKERKSEMDRDYYLRHSQKAKDYAKARYKKLKDNPKFISIRRAAVSRWKKRNPEQVFIRNCLHRCRLNNSNKDVIGYTAEQLRDHITSLFFEGMSWDNYGEWHIDHIKPIKAFIDEGVTDPAIINALDNLQPLWASENMSKGAKYDD